MNWTPLDEIRHNYLPVVEQALRNAYGSSNDSETRIDQVLFWNPMLRSCNAPQTRSSTTTPTASYAALPHIDVDVNAFENAAALVDLIWKNQISTIDNDESFSTKEWWINAIGAQGRRFAVVNAWKNVDPAQPIQRQPLAMYRPVYKHDDKAFPDEQPIQSQSHWYTFPQMRHDELLLFCQYDRHVQWPSDVWHLAVDLVNEEQGDTTATTRTSLDVRALILFHEAVPAAHDRFTADRTLAKLSLQASAAFCQSQADARRPQNAAKSG